MANNNKIIYPKSVLVSNRGEIARRVFTTCKRLNIYCVAVYTMNDVVSNHMKYADTSYEISSYLDADQIIQICIDNNIEAIHPGYGFLSESPEFVEKVEKNNIIWLGPNSKSISTFGLKHTARIFAKNVGVPIVPGSGIVDTINDAIKEANNIGYPIMLKCSAGGGGIGMYMCHDETKLRQQYVHAKRHALNFFGDDRVYIEKYVQQPHHIEVQVFGDGRGTVIDFGERECSIQRRHQKVVEECPSALVNDDLRQRITASARQLASAVEYNNAGTVEFLVDGETKDFYFLEMNTRLQVEHGITELIHSEANNSLDIVELMLIQANGKLNKIDLNQYKRKMNGHAIEVRIYAEDPNKNFQPSPGKLDEVLFPSNTRVDTVIETGGIVSPHYDPMIAKLMVYGNTRKEACELMSKALVNTRLKGTRTNLEYLRCIIDNEIFRNGIYTTQFLDNMNNNDNQSEYSGITILRSGVYTTVQDTGRFGNWRIGLPPSGAMDRISFRIANKLVGNKDDAAGLECTYDGCTVLFNQDAVIAVCGGTFPLKINDNICNLWQNYHVKKGDQVIIGNNARGNGQRCYLAISGGIDVPIYLNSRSTFPGGKLGGYQGRILRKGDRLELLSSNPQQIAQYYSPLTLPISNKWVIRMLRGPQEAPDFLPNESMDIFFNTEWKVHYNSNRFGVRFIGPKLKWKRNNGGDGGSHPSNVLDNEYTIGSVNITGDMPIMLGVDGPSLGGFVCAATTCEADLWKMGQLMAGDIVKFQPITISEANSLQNSLEHLIANIGPKTETQLPKPVEQKLAQEYSSVLLRSELNLMCVRMQGSSAVLVEFGAIEKLNLNNRFLVYALEEELKKLNINGIIEYCPGVRSLQIIYDNKLINLPELLSALDKANNNIPSLDDLIIPSRIVHLPIVLRDRWTKEAEATYMKSVRPEAPYLPSNYEFVVRNNGLSTAQQLEDIILNASYMVLGLGDVYLGAPCALPVDPRHRIVNPKYNPARTFTPEGGVGIGGSFMCIYPMQSPGGYQLVGRSLPIWNSYCKNKCFTNGKPWLLRMFDQVRFYLVTEDELENSFEKFRNGLFDINIEETTFSVREYNEFINRPEVKKETEEFQKKQRAAAAIELAAEEAYWERKRLEDEKVAQMAPKKKKKEEVDNDEPSIGVGIPGANEIISITAEMSARLWKYTVAVGDKVKEGDTVAILESMKMEINVESSINGEVIELLQTVGDTVEDGEILLRLKKC